MNENTNTTETTGEQVADSSGDASQIAGNVPTQGEIHIEYYFPKGYDPGDEPWKSIREHHNSERAWSAHLRIQLAAERELREKISLSWMLSKSDNKQLREQLAAAHKQYEELAVASTEKLATAVEALRDVRCRVIKTTADIIDAALAKIGEGK